MSTISQTPAILTTEQTDLMTAMLRVLDAIRPSGIRAADPPARTLPLRGDLELVFRGDEYRNDRLILRRVGSDTAIFVVTRSPATPGGGWGSDRAAITGRIGAVITAIKTILLMSAI